MQTGEAVVDGVACSFTAKGVLVSGGPLSAQREGTATTNENGSGELPELQEANLTSLDVSLL